MSSHATIASCFRMVSRLYASARSRWGNISLAGALSSVQSRSSLVARRKCRWQKRFAEERFRLNLAGRFVLCRNCIDVAVDGDVHDFVGGKIGLTPADNVALVIPAYDHSHLL